MNLNTLEKPNDIIKNMDTFNVGCYLTEQLKSELVFSYNPQMYKSGACCERIPQEKDWYYIRAVSLLKYLHTNPLGIKKLLKRYGKMRSRGSAPSKRYLASGFLTRHLVQELQRVGYLAIHPKGRFTSSKGKQLLLNAVLQMKSL